MGETDNIQAQLLEHLEGTDSLRIDEDPTGFSFELCAPQDRIARQRRLIVELDPCLQRANKPTLRMRT